MDPPFSLDQHLMATNQRITFINSQLVVILKRGLISSSNLVTSFTQFKVFLMQGLSEHQNGIHLVNTTWSAFFFFFFGREMLPGH